MAKSGAPPSQVMSGLSLSSKDIDDEVSSMIDSDDETPPSKKPKLLKKTPSKAKKRLLSEKRERQREDKAVNKVFEQMELIFKKKNKTA